MKPLPKNKRIKLSPHEWQKLKNIVFERDKWTCRICGKKIKLTADHIIKRSQGGDDLEENIWTLCVDCHRRKDEYQLTPEEAAEIPIGTRYGKPHLFHFRPV